MSNPLHLTATTFTGVDGIVSYGYRMYDNYVKIYDDTHETLIKDDIELLVEVSKDKDDNIQDLIDDAKQHGICINGEFYDSEEVNRHI